MHKPQEQYEQMLQNIITLDSPINFQSASKPEKCCHFSYMLLTGPALFDLAKYLKLSPIRVVQDFCTTYQGSDSGLPIITLKSNKKLACPFLHPTKQYCKVLKASPLACKIYPIGRFYNSETKQHSYFIQPTAQNEQNVPHDQMYTLRQHLSLMGIDQLQLDEINETSDLFGEALTTISMHLQILKQSDQQITQSTLHLIAEALYYNYDNSQPYKPQLLNNLNILKQQLNM